MKKKFLLTSSILLLIIFFNAYNNSKKSFEGLTNSRQSEIKDVLKKIINESSYFRELLNIWIPVYNNDGSIKIDEIITKIKSFGKNYFLMAYTVNNLTSSNTFINTIAPKFQEIRSDIMNLQSYLVGKDRDGNIINSFYPSDKFLSDFINTIINTSDININETLTVLDIGSINIRSNFNNFIAKLKTTFNKVTYLDDNNRIQINYDQITFEEQLTTLLIPTNGVRITFQEWIEYFNTELLVEGGEQSGEQSGETIILEENIADIVYNIISPNLEVNMYWLERYRNN
jgi:hypothetical protein